MSCVAASAQSGLTTPLTSTVITVHPRGEKEKMSFIDKDACREAYNEVRDDTTDTTWWVCASYTHRASLGVIAKIIHTWSLFLIKRKEKKRKREMKTCFKHIAAYHGCLVTQLDFQPNLKEMLIRAVLPPTEPSRGEECCENDFFQFRFLSTRMWSEFTKSPISYVIWKKKIVILRAWKPSISRHVKGKNSKFTVRCYFNPFT